MTGSFLAYSNLLIASINLVKAQDLLAPFTLNWPPTHPPKHHHHEAPGIGSTRLDTSAELVLGTFAQEQENSWFYETYYPIVLKLPIPDWSPDAHRLNRTAPRCDNDDMSPNFLCPSQQHMDNILIKISHSTRFYKNIETASLFSTGMDDKVYDDNPSCSKIKPHFSHFSTSMRNFDLYITELQKRCPLARNLQMIEKVVTPSDIPQSSIRAAYQSFSKLHQAHRPTNGSDKHWKHTQMAGFTAFQNAFTLFTYADSIRWSNAYQSCQANRLDVNLIPPQTLMPILDEASRNLTRLGLGYNISVPMDRLLTNFYKLPLTDCLLAMDNNDHFLIVRLLLPVTRINKHYKLIKLNKVPFLIRQGKNSPLLHGREAGSLCEIKNYKYEETFLVEYDTSMRGESMPLMTSIMKAPPTCGPYHVCKIPDGVHRSLVDSCVEGIIAGDEDATKDECGFKCYPVTKKQMATEFPYVIQLMSNRFAVVGAMADEAKDKKVSIKCFGKTRVESLKQEKTDEATIITLPCPCQISIGETNYLPDYPCNGTLEVIHVTHVVGNGFDGFKGFEGADKAKNIQDTMNGSKGNKQNSTADMKDTRKILPDEVDDKIVSMGMEEDKIERLDDETIDDDVLFSIPFMDNHNGGEYFERGSGDDLLVVVDASYSSVGDVCTHIIVWIIGCCLLVSNVAMLFVLYKKGFVCFDSILYLK